MVVEVVELSVVVDRETMVVVTLVLIVSVVVLVVVVTTSTSFVVVEVITVDTALEVTETVLDVSSFALLSYLVEVAASIIPHIAGAAST